MTNEIDTRFAAQVDRILDGLDGTVGVAARDFTSGRALSYQPGEVFPTASTFKVPLLYALYRLADAGEIDLARRVTIETHHRVPGSGVLQDLDPGIVPTIRDLAVLMTTVSDNLATDLLYDLVGRDRLAAEIARLALAQTSIPFGCRGIFCHATGLDPDDLATTYGALRDALKNGPRNMDSIAYAADARNDTSTPADMVAMLAAIEAGDGISAASREAMIDILKRQKYNTIIPLHLPEETDVAHKTGSLRGIRNDVGIVYAPTGPYAIALMAKGLADEVEGSRRLAELSRIAWETFVGNGDD
ncbi:MAG: serine hydrolase [Thermomicrobiales bacterium]